MKHLLAVLACAALAWLAIAQTYETKNLDNVMLSNGLASGQGEDLASGTTINITNEVHIVTGITTIQTIAAPATIQPGAMLILIPRGIFALGTSGNVIIGVTAVVNKALVLVWDGSAWVPGYLI